MTDFVTSAPVETDAAPRTGSRRWVAFGAVMLFAVALLQRAVLPFNVDVSWWLIIADHVHDGQWLYADILETNPPMAGVVYFAASALARFVALRPEIVANALILAMVAASWAISIWMLRRSSLRRYPARGTLALGALALLAVMPMYDFGQREHLALLTFLSALALYILRAERISPSLGEIAIGGVAAALTIAIKPYFVVAVGASVVAAAWQARAWRVLFAPESWIVTALGAIYVAATYLVFPEYFTLVYPLVRDVYLLLKAPLSDLLLNSAMGLWIGGMIVVFVLSRGRGLDAPLTVTLAAAAGFAVSFVWQGKGFCYHAIPMVALALLAAGYAVGRMDRTADATKHLRVLAPVLLIAMFANACLWFNHSADPRDLKAEVATIAVRPKLLVLSALAPIAHPMARELDAVWISRQAAFWTREFVRRAQADGRIDADEAARLAPYVARERSGLIADIRKQPPDVVLVDNVDSDWGAWVAADPELSALLAPYTRVRTVDGVEIRSRPWSSAISSGRQIAGLDPLNAGFRHIVPGLGH